MSEVKDHLKIARQMQDVEKVLKELGVPLDRLDEILGHVDNYQSLNSELQEARKRQFFNDAWSICRVSGKDKEDRVSEQLRAFAVHIVLSAHHTLIAKSELEVDEIVDLIPPMESRSPYDV